MSGSPSRPSASSGAKPSVQVFRRRPSSGYDRHDDFTPVDFDPMQEYPAHEPDEIETSSDGKSPTTVLEFAWEPAPVFDGRWRSATTDETFVVDTQKEMICCEGLDDKLSIKSISGNGLEVLRPGCSQILHACYASGALLWRACFNGRPDVWTRWSPEDNEGTQSRFSREGVQVKPDLLIRDLWKLARTLTDHEEQPFGELSVDWLSLDFTAACKAKVFGSCTFSNNGSWDRSHWHYRLDLVGSPSGTPCYLYEVRDSAAHGLLLMHDILHRSDNAMIVGYCLSHSGVMERLVQRAVEHAEYLGRAKIYMLVLPEALQVWEGRFAFAPVHEPVFKRFDSDAGFQLWAADVARDSFAADGRQESGIGHVWFYRFDGLGAAWHRVPKGMPSEWQRQILRKGVSTITFKCYTADASSESSQVLLQRLLSPICDPWSYCPSCLTKSQLRLLKDLSAGCIIQKDSPIASGTCQAQRPSLTDIWEGGTLNRTLRNVLKTSQCADSHLQESQGPDAACQPQSASFIGMWETSPLSRALPDSPRRGRNQDSGLQELYGKSIEVAPFSDRVASDSSNPSSSTCEPDNLGVTCQAFRSLYAQLAGSRPQTDSSTTASPRNQLSSPRLQASPRHQREQVASTMWEPKSLALRDDKGQPLGRRALGYVPLNTATERPVNSPIIRQRNCASPLPQHRMMLQAASKVQAPPGTSPLSQQRLAGASPQPQPRMLGTSPQSEPRMVPQAAASGQAALSSQVGAASTDSSPSMVQRLPMPLLPGWSKPSIPWTPKQRPPSTALLAQPRAASLPPQPRSVTPPPQPRVSGFAPQLATTRWRDLSPPPRQSTAPVAPLVGPQVASLHRSSTPPPLGFATAPSARPFGDMGSCRLPVHAPGASGISLGGTMMYQ